MSYKYDATSKYYTSFVCFEKSFSFILTQDYIKPLIKLAICTILRDETNVKLEKTRILHYFSV